MKATFISCIVVLAMAFVPLAVAAGNGPTKSVYDQKAAKVQRAVDAALVTHKATSPKAKPVVKKATHATVTSGSLPFTGLDLGFLAVAGLVLVAMGASLRRITRKSYLG